MAHQQSATASPCNRSCIAIMGDRLTAWRAVLTLDQAGRNFKKLLISSEWRFVPHLAAMIRWPRPERSLVIAVFLSARASRCHWLARRHMTPALLELW